MKCTFSMLSLLVWAQMVFANPPYQPKEGMWLPALLNGFNIEEMQAMGCELTAEDIYSINHSSLKDAILQFGGGCTGSMISPQGLLLTNHHCGYSQVQSHSSVENDYLTDGFWAMNQDDELPNPGLTAMFIVRMEDVTARVLNASVQAAGGADKQLLIAENMRDLETEAVEDTHYEAEVKSFFEGNKYYLFVTETFRDVRLVGAPPSAIGKFGGDLDNWMWPRHTGDFSIFRIYAGPDNEPADYSPDNVPYHPKKFLPISLSGVQPGDFTMVFGFPGTTQEYLFSERVKHIMEVSDPQRIALREIRLEAVNAAMKESDELRIMYAAKQSRIANAWKKWIGEVRGLEQLNAIDQKKKLEKRYDQWVSKRDNQGYAVLDSFALIYPEYNVLDLNRDYLNEAAFGIELVEFAWRINRGLSSLTENSTEIEIQAVRDELTNRTIGFFKNYYPAVDRQTTPLLLKAYYTNIDKKYHPSIFKTIENKFGGDFEKYTAYLFKKSDLLDRDKLLSDLEDLDYDDVEDIMEDPALVLLNSFLDNYYENIRPGLSALDVQLDRLQKKYMSGLQQMNQGRPLYPNANSTMRIAYGNVETYYPIDGVEYLYQTTLDGIMEKAATGEADYTVPDKLVTLYNTKSYGRWAENGKVPVCFIASNHTTGGNSGSPVLNSQGNLIGLNFDRNWEGTMSDIMYDPDQCRNIMVDVRYIAFIIEQFAGAKRLVREMQFIEDEPASRKGSTSTRKSSMELQPAMKAEPAQHK